MDERKQAIHRALKWRLAPRVADLGYSKVIAASRGRLLGSALASTAVVLVGGTLLFGWMRDSSQSAGLNIGIIGLLFCVVVVAAYIDALALGDLFFPGRWRERVLLGKQFEAKDWEEERALVQEYNAPFYVIWVLCIALLGYGVELASGGFLSYYQKIGFTLVLLRSDDPNDRVMGLEKVVNPFSEAQWENEELHEAISRLVLDPDKRVQALAVYAVGRLGVFAGAEDTLEVFKTSDDLELRREAAQALGRLGWAQGVNALSHRLSAKNLTREEALGALRGIAFSGDARMGRAVARFIQKCDAPAELRDEEVVVTGFWAIAQIADESSRELALNFAAGKLCDPGPRIRCAAAQALERIATVEDIPAMQRIFDATDPSQECEPYYWRYREEKMLALFDDGPLRAKFVKAVGNRKSVDSYEWIWRVGSNTDENIYTRATAEAYARAFVEMANKK